MFSIQRAALRRWLRVRREKELDQVVREYGHMSPKEHAQLDKREEQLFWGGGFGGGGW
jgi:hypothetical protein